MGGAVQLFGRRVASGVSRHAAIVQHHGGDGRSGPDRGLEVQSGHPECAVSHEVEAELIGPGQLGADHQGNAVAQVGGLAPADVAVGRGAGVERHHGVAGRAGVVGDDAVFLVQVTLDLADHSVGVDRNIVRIQQRGPFGDPPVSDPLDLGSHLGLTLTAVLAGLSFDLFNHGLQSQLGVARQADIDGEIFVDVFDTLHVVNDDLAVGDGLAVAGPGHA